MALELPRRGIEYRHLLALGGRRKELPDSPNDGWEHPAFRSYADYAQTEAFAHALSELIEMARSQTTAIMCAEAVWWRCHRRIISDYLIARGVEVAHILGPSRADIGTLTPFARVCPNGTIVYSAAPMDSPCA